MPPLLIQAFMLLGALLLAPVLHAQSDSSPARDGPAAQRFAAAAASIVRVEVERDDIPPMFGPGKYSGPGLIWDARGHVVTFFSLVHGVSRVFVNFDNGERHSASVIGEAQDKSLAVLRIGQMPIDFTPVSVGASANLNIGQFVYVINASERRPDKPLAGAIRGLNGIWDDDAHQTVGAIEFNMEGDPRDVTSPLLDGAGRVVGFVTGSYNDPARAKTMVAIPADVLTRVVPMLIETGRVPRPRIGLILGPVQGRGIVVSQAFEGLPASAAGITAGDVLLAINGKPLRTIVDFWSSMEGATIDDYADVRVLREGRTFNLKVRVVDTRR